MTWVLVVGSLWLVLAVLVAVVIGRGIRLADEHAAPAAWTADVERYLLGRAGAGTRG